MFKYFKAHYYNLFSLSQKYFFFATFGIFILFAGGCAKYKSKPFTPLTTVASIYTTELCVGAKILNDQELYHYFSRRLKGRGYVPIQITIQNKSSDYYLLTAENISLQIASREAVAKLLHLNTVKRMVTFLIPAILLSGLIFVPAAIIEGSWCNNANKKLCHDFERRVFDRGDTLLIQPHSECNKIFFIAAEDFSNEFDIRLKERESLSTATFVVNV